MKFKLTEDWEADAAKWSREHPVGTLGHGFSQKPVKPTFRGRPKNICPECKGEGSFDTYTNGRHELINCPGCLGTGKKR